MEEVRKALRCGLGAVWVVGVGGGDGRGGGGGYPWLATQELVQRNNHVQSRLAGLFFAGLQVFENYRLIEAHLDRYRFRMFKKIGFFLHNFCPLHCLCARITV